MAREHEADSETERTEGGRTLSEPGLYLLAAASAIVTANAYYIHPIIAVVAESFGVSDALIGLVPAANQMALALGIFFLLPLGDLVSNRRLTSIFVAAQFVAIAGMALAEDFAVFAAASAALGFFTVAPYLLPAYVSKRVPARRLGHATAVLTTGIVAGILLARMGSGVIAEYAGWRAVYVTAAALMLVMAIALPLIMEPRERSAPVETGYGALLLSILPMVRRHPDIFVAGTIQALFFGVFLAFWLGLGLHLVRPDMGYGVDVVGYLAAFSIFSLATTPRLGAWADRIGAREARVRLAATQVGAAVALPFLGGSLWLLMVPIVVMNLVGPAIDVAGRMTFLSLAPEIRTRLMTVYIVLMFSGGGLASWAATAAYDHAGWNGTALLCIALALAGLALSVFSLRRQGPTPR